MILTLTFIIALALVFEYINGFHDSANAIATVVSTNVLTPRQAVIMSACLNFCGAMLGTQVAKTIGAGIVSGASVTAGVVVFALLSAVIWDLFTWYFALPSSSSHALIGGLVGAAGVASGLSCVNFRALFYKVIIPMFVSPVLGFLCAFAVMIGILWLFRNKSPSYVNRNSRHMQLFSSALVSIAHGTNDAQKTMGIITIALISGGVLSGSAASDFHVPVVVVIICALTMAAGTLSGGWRIIKTLGSKMIKIKPVHGFAAEATSAALIMSASHFGVPLSTTHVISSAIYGAGSASKKASANTSLVKNIIFAWVMTIPVCAALSAVLSIGFRMLQLGVMK